MSLITNTHDWPPVVRYLAQPAIMLRVTGDEALIATAPNVTQTVPTGDLTTPNLDDALAYVRTARVGSVVYVRDVDEVVTCTVVRQDLHDSMLPVKVTMPSGMGRWCRANEVLLPPREEEAAPAETLEEFKAELLRIVKREASRHRWCAQVDDALVELGMGPLRTTGTVTLRLHLDALCGVRTARYDASAVQRSVRTEQTDDALTIDLSGDYEDVHWTLEDVSVDLDD